MAARGGDDYVAELQAIVDERSAPAPQKRTKEQDKLDIIALWDRHAANELAKLEATRERR